MAHGIYTHSSKAYYADAVPGGRRSLWLETMPAYMVVEVSVQDPQWVADYQRDVPAIIERFGGRYLTPASRAVLLEGEGDAPQTLAILEYPNMDAAKAMLACPEYQPYAKARQAGATTRIVAIEPRAPKTAS